MAERVENSPPVESSTSSDKYQEEISRLKRELAQAKFLQTLSLQQTPSRPVPRFSLNQGSPLPLSANATPGTPKPIVYVGKSREPKRCLGRPFTSCRRSKRSEIETSSIPNRRDF
ncbi:hypothetical protein SNE40_011109 [Patella caerulea]|uniref:Uncharacterized protein n=1 Tax=Patella caerulea TaxID=87958 RepID=A0AAN8K3E9_PATCE